MAIRKIAYILIFGNLVFASASYADYRENESRYELNNAQASMAVRQANQDSQQMQMEQRESNRQQQYVNMQRQIDRQQQDLQSTRDRSRGYGW